MFRSIRCSFLFALVLLTGCPQPPAGGEPADSTPVSSDQPSDQDLLKLKREWMLVEFPGFTREALIESKAKLDLRSHPQAGLYLGCNQIGFQWPKQSNKHIDANSMISTAMACVDMQLEDRGKQFLLSITTYKVQGHELILSNDKGEVMRFVASDWD